MSKNPSQQDHETMPISDLFTKFKRLRLFEPSVGVLGFFFITVCVICCFFYLDYRSVAKGYRVPGESERFTWLRLEGEKKLKRVEFLSEVGDGCDLFDGDWVWDEDYPLYQSKDCSFLDDGFRCSENGRPDLFYTKWRWQPQHCNLPRYISNFNFNLSLSFSKEQLVLSIVYLYFLGRQTDNWKSWFLFFSFWGYVSDFLCQLGLIIKLPYGKLFVS